MVRRILGIGGIVLMGILMIGAVAAWAQPGTAGNAYGGRQGGARELGTADRSGMTPIVVEGTARDLDGDEAEALMLALDDEYKAWSVYEQVIADFGSVRPFTNIQRAEENHIAALVTLFDRYGLDVPTNEWLGNVSTFDTLTEACEAGVQAEIDNAELYDQLFTMVDNPDIIQVFTSLQQASETKHLPAFERCAD